MATDSSELLGASTCTSKARQMRCRERHLFWPRNFAPRPPWSRQRRRMVRAAHAAPLYDAKIPGSRTTNRATRALPGAATSRSVAVV